MFPFVVVIFVFGCTISIIDGIVNDIPSLPTYDAFTDKCVSFKDNYLYSNKRKSKFKALFYGNDNNKSNVEALMFMYENKEHTQNIFHQLNWYLSHFHDIISSPSLLAVMKEYFINNDNKLNIFKITEFKIIIIFPQSDLSSYDWSCKMLKSYPFKLRWGNIFHSIKVECYFYNLTSPLYINPNTMLINDYMLKEMMDIYSIPNCIKIDSRLYSLLEYKYSDWNINNQPYYQWINEWTNNFKKIHNISSPKKCENNKWNLGLIQRSKGNRFLLDSENGNDLFNELIKNKELNSFFKIERVSFESDKLDIIDQAKFMNSHDIIIGVHGASLTNIIFMNQKYKKCNGIEIKPGLIEIAFRFGWCSDYDLLSPQDKTDKYDIFDYNLTNKQLLERWRKCHNKYYKKAEFFALMYANTKHEMYSIENITTKSRYLEVNAVRYGDEMSYNFIKKKEIYVNTSFLIGEIFNLYKDKNYDFRTQLERYQHTIYAKEGMVFPGQGQNLFVTVKILQITLGMITIFGLILWCWPKELSSIKVKMKIFGTEYLIFGFQHK